MQQPSPRHDRWIPLSFLRALAQLFPALTIFMTSAARGQTPADADGAPIPIDASPADMNSGGFDPAAPDPSTPTHEFRTINGTGNNPSHSSWGAAGNRLLRRSNAAYGDGISAPTGDTRPSPRLISNVIADQGNADIINNRLMAAMIYAWGQFIDHDIDLTPTGGTEVLTIPVPLGDPYFDPFNTGTQVMLTTRSVFDPATGTSTSNPRQQVNVITAWLDASMVYGSDDSIAFKLRTLAGGLLKTSPGNMLPINNTQYFPTGPLVMANDAHRVPDDQLYAAGDVRANENIELTALHTLFVREHNYWAGQIAAIAPWLPDEQLYQRARAIVIGEIESITYNSWLPALLGANSMPWYSGYRSSVNPGINNEFSTAAFRLGHSLLGDDVEFLDNQGNPVADAVSLSDAFFNPPLLAAVGIDPVLKYLASDPASELDNTIVGSVRNFLFGPPGHGGLDLASLNIERGRDHGLPDYNTVRAAYGRPRANGFGDITNNVATQSKLAALYGSVDNIDLWVGLLAERHILGASVGPTLRTMIAEQFARVRDGDRMWYERTLSRDAVRRIESTSLADVIRRNTSISNLQSNVFFFQATISGTVFVDLNHDGQQGRGEPGLAGAVVQLISEPANEVVHTESADGRGAYHFDVFDGLRTGAYHVQAVGSGGQILGTSRSVAITRGAQFIDRVNVALPG